MAEQSPTITASHPSPTMLRVINPVMKVLLKTPVLGPMRGQMMVVNFNGRKSGRRYSIPLSAHRIDDALYAFTDAQWKVNFRDGATADVFLDGKTTSMRGELIREPATVGDVMHRCAESYGAKEAQRMMGLKFRGPQVPTLEEFAEAAQRLHIGAVRFTT